MSKKLVIVESPNKVKAIQTYLGSDFDVVASSGHIFKMQTRGKQALGIDFENWEPLYSLDASKKPLVKMIKEKVDLADEVYLATDPDREGEAISDHLRIQFKLDQKQYWRIKYNEITKDAILNALANRGQLDSGLIDSQKARRLLDRIIGFRLSNLLRSKLRNTPGSPTAGRVQSIALKLVVDRENEIRSFIPEKYFKLHAVLAPNNDLAYYFNENATNSDRKEWILDNELDKIKEYFTKAPKKLKVINIKQTDKKLGAITPLKQSTLYSKSGFYAKSTQIAAQRLFEGYNGEDGIITYPRTDSTRLSATFVAEAKKFVANKYGEEYVATDVKGISGDQDAHEAIRPTNLKLTPQLLKEKYPNIDNIDLSLYKLIYEITLQSVMKAPIISSTSYTYQTGDYKFKNNYSKVKFDGYYILSDKASAYDKIVDPKYTLDQEVDVNEFNFTEHQTKPAPRYHDGSLIEALDAIGVGRPSTFAVTVSTIQERKFVTKEKDKSLHPTEFGQIVLERLIKSFPNIINEEYTAKIELELDDIEENKNTKNSVMDEFYSNFLKEFEQASDKIEAYTFPLIELEEPCPDDGGLLQIKTNKKAQKFVACNNFPKCRFTRSCTNEEKALFADDTSEDDDLVDEEN
ncbi:type I DNA topoisomerase [Mycoplasma corogypsi]|uniref:type I DNA topoisomerase n=1 Tax=Mycoplasma corogypsi TaxID=2106 RepID=UPI003872C04D